jgi:OFA family oxalate/formate antiporter-like MFS transporter
MHPPQKTSSYLPWIALMASTGINMTMGINYSWSVIKKALVVQWGWTNVQASLPYTAYMLTFTLMMIFGGRMQDKFGPRIVATAGSILVGAGLVACGFAETPFYMMLSYCITGFGNGMCYSTTIPACVKWFPPEKRGMVTGVVVAGTGVASGYFSPLADWLLGSYGISRTFVILGAAVFAVLSVMSQTVKNPPEGYVPSSSNGAQPEPCKRTGTCDIGWPDIVRSPTFVKLWLMYLGAASAGLMIMAHIATIAKTQAAWEKGFYLVIVFAAFNAASRLVAGYLSDRYGRLRLMLIIFAVQMVNIALFAFYGTPASLVFGTAVIGAAYGAAFALFPLATADFFGLKNLGGNYGLLITAWGCAGLVGPILAGWAVDVTGRYGFAYAISAALLAMAVLLVPTIKPARNPQ